MVHFYGITSRTQHGACHRHKHEPGRYAYKHSAPISMGRLLVKLGYKSLEAVYEEYPQLKNGAGACK